MTIAFTFFIKDTTISRDNFYEDVYDHEWKLKTYNISCYYKTY